MAGVDGVRIQEVRKRFSRTGRWVLDGVDAVLEAGSVTLLVGANGSGKSTLLRTVAGASTPSAGRVLRPRTRCGPSGGPRRCCCSSARPRPSTPTRAGTRWPATGSRPRCCCRWRSG
ncbi:MAG TPA: ATP-binding cassette domain-containing protein [Mycobacteriales bacterium]|nr:ATP-binding cassette domain-containing protein [Mycobacteriales bacterium]